MNYHVTIKGIRNAKGYEFPIKGLNELIDGKIYNPRTRKYTNPIKNANDSICFKNIYRDLVVKKVVLKTPIRCHYKVYTQDKKHDRGNLYAAVEKSFLDALQKAKCLSNDTWDNVYDSTFESFLERQNPRVEIDIEEVDVEKETKDKIYQRK